MNPRFDGDAGELPAIRIGQFLMADDGLNKKDFADMDKEYARCDTLDEQIAVLFDHPEVFKNIFIGALISRTDDAVTIQTPKIRDRQETRKFPINKVMAIFHTTKLEEMKGTILSPLHISEAMARMWKHVRWPKAE